MFAPIVVLSAVLAQGGAPPLTVSAAISLTEALEEAAAAYRVAGGSPAVFNFGGSNALARQIVNGAPVDVFISADEAQMEVVEKADLVVAGTRVPVVANRLVLVVDSRSRVTAVTDLGAAGVRRIAIGDPVAVPAGVYARQYLERINEWTRLQPKIVPVANVRAALTAVQNGSADAAFVYATDARIAPALRVAVTVTGPQAPRIVYPGAVVKTSRQPRAAAKFLEFLRTPPALAVFEKHGFTSATDVR
jgi:molybdate transport system substrate-binding protein